MTVHLTLNTTNDTFQHLSQAKPALAKKTDKHAVINVVPSNASAMAGLSAPEKKRILDFSKIPLGPLKGVMELKDLGAAVMLPVAIKNLAADLTGIKKGNAAENVEQIAGVCDDVKDTGERVATIAEGLKDIQVAPASHFSWLKPFGYLMTALSVASIVSGVFETIRMVKLYRAIKRETLKGVVDGKPGVESYRNVIALLQKNQEGNKDFIKDVFGAKSRDFFEKLDKMEQERNALLESGDEKEAARGKEMIKPKIDNIRRRVRHNIFTSALSVLSATVSAVAAVILIVSPLLPVGLFMAAGSVALDTGKLLHHKFIDYKFIKGLQIKRSRMEWIKA